MILGLLCEDVFIKINIMYVLKTAVRTMRLRRLILCLCIYVRQYFVSIQNNKIFFVKYSLLCLTYFRRLCIISLAVKIKYFTHICAVAFLGRNLLGKRDNCGEKSRNIVSS